MTWDEWEDYLAGMYVADFTAQHVADSLALLRHPGHFHETAREMVREWSAAAVHNLRNMWTGRNAWVGQASCLYAHGAPGAATRAAWGALALDEQRAANAVAVEVRTEWERRNVGQTLFDH